VADWTSDAAHHTGDFAKGFGEDVTGMIRRYPVAALLVGVGIGMCLARMTSKSS
jgi:hypothetical protein